MTIQTKLPPTPSASRTLRFFPDWYRVACSVIEKPYKEGACGPDEFYCAGLVAWWFRQFGFAVTDPQAMDAEQLAGEAFAGYFVPVDAPDFGDVAKITGPFCEKPHLGIVTFSGLLQATVHGVRMASHGSQTVNGWYRLKAIAAEVPG